MAGCKFCNRKSLRHRFNLCPKCNSIRVAQFKDDEDARFFMPHVFKGKLIICRACGIPKFCYEGNEIPFCFICDLGEKIHPIPEDEEDWTYGRPGSEDRWGVG